MIRDDPELGTERWCPGCQEWWPLDDEFWYFKRHRAGSVAVARGQAYVRRSDTVVPMNPCRGCWLERSRLAYEARKAS